VDDREEDDSIKQASAHLTPVYSLIGHPPFVINRQKAKIGDPDIIPAYADYDANIPPIGCIVTWKPGPLLQVQLLDSKGKVFNNYDIESRSNGEVQLKLSGYSQGYFFIQVENKNTDPKYFCIDYEVLVFAFVHA